VIVIFIVVTRTTIVLGYTINREITENLFEMELL
jgi:hypothetical protein